MLRSKPTIDRERILKSHGIDSELIIRGEGGGGEVDENTGGTQDS